MERIRKVFLCINLSDEGCGGQRIVFLLHYRGRLVCGFHGGVMMKSLLKNIFIYLLGVVITTE